MLSATQCRMARAALRWTVKDLARQARIDSNTVVRFENGKHKSNDVTVLAIKQAFEAANVRFEGGGVFPLEGEHERVALTAPEWKEIDHWATARGIGDRLEAIRQLVALGLKASAEEQQAAEESAASLLASEEGLRTSKRKGKV